MFVGLQRIYIIHPLTGGRVSCIVIKDRSPSYHYLALCLYQLMKAAWEAVGVEVYCVCGTVELVFLCVHNSLKVNRGKTMQSPYKMPESTNTSFFPLLFDVASKRKISGKAQNYFCCRLIWVLTRLPLPSTETATMIHPSFPLSVSFYTLSNGTRVPLHIGGFCNTCAPKQCLLKMVDSRTNAQKILMFNNGFITNLSCYEKTSYFILSDQKTNSL